jgi:hypothetical protein
MAAAENRDNFADNSVGSNGRVPPRFGVPSTMKSALGAARGHGDEPVREHPFVMATEQHVAADDLVGRDRCNRDHVAVPDGRVHAGALGAETDSRPGAQRFFDQGAKEVGIPPRDSSSAMANLPEHSGTI